MKAPETKQIIERDLNNLRIGADTDCDEDGTIKPVAMLLFTPAMKYTNQH